MRKVWTPKEDEFLNKYYGSKGPKWCAEKLEAPLGSTRYRAQKIYLTYRSIIGSSTKKETKKEVRNRVQRGDCIQCGIGGGFPYCCKEHYNDLSKITNFRGCKTYY